jgi:hypothetical protein
MPRNCSARLLLKTMDRFFLGLITASTIALATAIALATPNVKSVGISDKSSILFQHDARRWDTR